MVDGSLRILVVEDNPPDAMIIEELLAEVRGQRCESTCADRLRDALEIARRGSFDVVLLDLGLPDSQGLESLIRLRRDLVSLPVIIMTHLDDEELALRAAEYGAHDYLVKGQFTGAELVRSIRYAIERSRSEKALHAQLERMNLLARLTRAIGERQDLRSICQVVLGSLEDQLPLDFGCILLHDRAEHSLVVAEIGERSRSLASEMALPVGARVAIEPSGLSRCVQGQLVHEPDTQEGGLAFPERLARGQLRSMVAAPLVIESDVFGVLVGARHPAGSFSSPECEFLRQLSEHVALAAHQAELHAALQRAYDDLRQTQQAVMQQERLRALGQMASGIAHDINNAISPVALYTESLLETEANLSDQARDQLSTIQRAIDDVAQTVARLCEFYRAREPELVLRPVRLNQVVQEVVDLTRARWSDMPQRRGLVVEMSLQLSPDDPTILGVASELRAALTNLVFNAVDAMPAGGRLTLRTASDAATRVEVVDTGSGMSPEARRRCLEPFFTTKGKRGTGLGLAMVYGIVQRHSGDIEIESAPGQGTAIRLSFAPAGRADRQVARADPPRPRRLRILLVDDDPVLLKSLRDVLEGDGHMVRAAAGGQAGIDLFQTAQRGGEPFGLVITDLGMPHVDGRQVASTVKASRDATPVILLTGWGQRPADDTAFVHVDRVLAKPPKLADLRAALCELTSAVPT